MRRRALAVAAALAGLAASDVPVTFRFSRPIEDASGWTRIDLPGDVLDACRPGLPDVRIMADGEEIPYASAEAVGRSASTSPLFDVESAPNDRTTALLDRGPKPPLADRATLVVDGTDFLKPVVLESSDDRSDWKEIARGSVFAANGTRMLTLRFAPNGRRFWRFRFDDRNGDPIRPSGVIVRPAAPAAPEAAERPLEVSVSRDAAKGTTRASLILPGANLGVQSLRLDAEEPAFSRRVRVFERILFRDEIRRPLLAEAVVSKGPGAVPELDLPGPVEGRTLELEIEDGDSPPLKGLRATARIEPVVLVFFAPAGSAPTLVYGSGAAEPPRYDVAPALARGAPDRIARARLGPATEHATAPVFEASLGPAIDAAAWKERRAIRLPDSGTLAYCNLPPDARWASVRIVDEQNRQVPYLLERASREVWKTVRPRWETRGDESVAEVTDLPAAPLEGVEIDASGPAYFSREVLVEEQTHDARGPADTRMVVSARWERRPGDPPEPLRVSIGSGGGMFVERGDRNTLRLRVRNGDNPPIALGAVRLISSVTRIDFAFRPGSKLVLLSGNPEAAPPRYDFALLAGAVLAAPAGEATLGAAEVTAAPARRTPLWLWGALVAAVLLVGLALARTMRRV